MITPLIGVMLGDLQWTTVNANQAVWTDVVPQYGYDLWYHLQLRSAAAATSDIVAVYINGDTTGSHNHFQRVRVQDAGAAYSESTTAGGAPVSASTAPADVYSPILVHIQNFRSARQKVVHLFACSEESALSKNMQWVAVKRQGAAVTGLITDPVTSVTFQANSGGALLSGTLRRAIGS